jgi:hypothetical protein
MLAHGGLRGAFGGIGGAGQWARLQGEQMLQKGKIALNVGARRLSEGSGLQFFAQAHLHKRRAKFRAGWNIQNIGSCNPHGSDFATIAHMQGESPSGIEGGLGRGV